MGKYLEKELKRIANALEKLVELKRANILSHEEKFDFSSGSIFFWSMGISNFKSLDHSFEQDLDYLIGIDKIKADLEYNTQQFAKGFRVNNVLLWGARGMGKSSLVRATVSKLIKSYGDLKLVEIPRAALPVLGDILGMMENKKNRFVLFCDDLSFSHEEESYHILKSLLDGGVNRYENIVFYATSNRRHLINRNMNDNLDISQNDEIDQKISLSDRFGLWLGFYPCDQNTYLQMSKKYLERLNYNFTDPTWREKAIEWQLTRGSRSGRSAFQFACDFLAKNHI